VGDGLSRELKRVRELAIDADGCAQGAPGADEDTLPLLAAAGLRYQVLRLSGRSAFESWRTSASWMGVQGHPAFRGAFPEALEPGPAAIRDEGPGSRARALTAISSRSCPA
jgi:hypothetical protein